MQHHFFLVRSNAQGELSPLEIGLHAVGAVEKGVNRHTGAGLSEYATAIGKSQAYISQVRNAASVYLELSQLNSSQQLDLSALIGKSQHLNEIHKSPQELWPVMVELLTPSQRAQAATEALEGYEQEVDAESVSQPVDQAISTNERRATAKAGKMFDVSRQSVSDAKYVMEHGTDDNALLY